jgi:hypothetical protein
MLSQITTDLHADPPDGVGLDLLAIDLQAGSVAVDVALVGAVGGIILEPADKCRGRPIGVLAR